MRERRRNEIAMRPMRFMLMVVLFPIRPFLTFQTDGLSRDEPYSP